MRKSRLDRDFKRSLCKKTLIIDRQNILLMFLYIIIIGADPEFH